MSNVVNEISKVSEILSVNFGTNLPVKIDFEFPEKQLFNFYLAPRVEDWFFFLQLISIFLYWDDGLTL